MKTVSGSNRRSGLSPAPEVGVLLGGASPERKISLRSGRAVEKALQREGFRTRRIDPSRVQAGSWVRDSMDVAFVALHGKGGEDGRIQRILERAGIPYTGSGVTGCYYSFNKQRTKERLDACGLPTPEYTVLNRRNWQARLKHFAPPFFIKPLEDGSSLGVFCVEDLQKSRAVLKKALRKYGRLMAERRITGREFTVGVLGRRTLPVIEINPLQPFYDYRAKYTKGLCRYEAPAPISGTWSRKLRRLALRVHEALQLRDFSRVDIMTDRKGRPYVLEVNAIPGLTEISLLPKAARCAGLSFEKMCARLVRYASRRGPASKTGG